jgi:hypothetical protein
MAGYQGWMPREQWDALVRGEGCPACAEVTSSEPSNEHGFFVADLDLSRLRLAANQFVTGYCVLLCHRRVREPYELSKQDRVLFFEDMTRVGQALETVFKPLKIREVRQHTRGLRVCAGTDLRTRCVWSIGREESMANAPARVPGRPVSMRIATAYTAWRRFMRKKHRPPLRNGSIYRTRSDLPPRIWSTWPCRGCFDRCAVQRV